MNNGLENKRTKKNKDKLKWNYRKIIICIEHIVKNSYNEKVNKIEKLKRKERLNKEIIKKKGLNR
jgi:hypothetical protein